VADPSKVYDGVRRRALPVLLSALKPGNDDDQMKGALWTINLSVFGKYAVSGFAFTPLMMSVAQYGFRIIVGQWHTPRAIWVST